MPKANHLRPSSRMPMKKAVAKFNPHARRPRLRLHGTIARDLGIRIVSRRLKPGDLLDNEIAASERLRVSRTAYREAVRILSAKVSCIRDPRSARASAIRRSGSCSTRMCSRTSNSSPMTNCLPTSSNCADDPTCRCGAGSDSPHARFHLDRMRRALDEIGKHTLAVEAGQLADREFHSILLSASENAFVSPDQ